MYLIQFSWAVCSSVGSYLKITGPRGVQFILNNSNCKLWTLLCILFNSLGLSVLQLAILFQNNRCYRASIHFKQFLLKIVGSIMYLIQFSSAVSPSIGYFIQK